MTEGKGGGGGEEEEGKEKEEGRRRRRRRGGGGGEEEEGRRRSGERYQQFLRSSSLALAMVLNASSLPGAWFLSGWRRMASCL